MFAFSISIANSNVVDGDDHSSSNNSRLSVSVDKALDLLVGSPVENQVFQSRSYKDSQSHSLYQSRKSVNSVNTADSSAVVGGDTTPSRSFFNFSRKKTHSMSVSDSAARSKHTIGSIQANANNVKNYVHQTRPVAVIAILFSKTKELSPPLREHTTSRSSGLFRRNTEEESFNPRYQNNTNSRGSESNQNKDSLNAALMEERISEVV